MQNQQVQGQSSQISDQKKFIYTPTNTIMVRFASQYLPEKVKFRHCIYPVAEFIPSLKTCYNCYRFNHVSKYCRGKTRCRWCGIEKQKGEHLQCDFKLKVDKSKDEKDEKERL